MNKVHYRTLKERRFDEHILFLRRKMLLLFEFDSINVYFMRKSKDKIEKIKSGRLS